jgi:hypothetical protein
MMMMMMMMMTMVYIMYGMILSDTVSTARYYSTDTDTRQLQYIELIMTMMHVVTTIHDIITRELWDETATTGRRARYLLGRKKERRHADKLSGHV